MKNIVWIFNGNDARFPSGVFSSEQNARKWIFANSLDGVLSEYPLDEGAYDNALRLGMFVPKKDNQNTSRFISNFSSTLRHFHFVNGIDQGGISN